MTQPSSVCAKRHVKNTGKSYADNYENVAQSKRRVRSDGAPLGSKHGHETLERVQVPRAAPGVTGSTPVCL